MNAFTYCILGAFVSGHVHANRMIAGETIANTVAVFRDRTKVCANPRMLREFVFVDAVRHVRRLTRRQKPFLRHVMLQKWRLCRGGARHHIKHKQMPVDSMSGHCESIVAKMCGAGFPQKVHTFEILKLEFV